MKIIRDTGEPEKLTCCICGISDCDPTLATVKNLDGINYCSQHAVEYFLHAAATFIELELEKVKSGKEVTAIVDNGKQVLDLLKENGELKRRIEELEANGNH